MRTNLDFSPFVRSSIGFDRAFSLLADLARVGANENGPGYNIVREGDAGYRIVLAVPGYEPDQLSIDQRENVLTVSGKAPAAPVETELLHEGLRAGDFTLRFKLADYVDVASANLRNGLLSIALKRELPEAMKPRRIPIATIRSTNQLEARNAA